MTKKAAQGDWVRIKNTVLKVGERAPQVPEETKAMPLEMLVNGFLVEKEAEIGDQVNITSLAGLNHQGRLAEIMPNYEVNYGRPQPELLTIGPELRAILKEVVKNG